MNFINIWSINWNCFSNDKGQPVRLLPNWGQIDGMEHSSCNKAKYIYKYYLGQQPTTCIFNLHKSKDNFTRQLSIHFVDSPHKTMLNAAIVQLQEEGIISSLEKKWYNTDIDCSAVEKVRSKQFYT